VLLFLLAVGFRPDTLPFPTTGEYSDSTISRYPDALYFRHSLLEDRAFPLWNPHLMGGQPFAANPGTKVFYPLTWLLLLWTPTLHLSVLTGLHLWWGGLGLWCWGRRTGLEAWPAFLAALGYTFAPKLMAHAGAGHLDLLMGMAWLPWLLLGLHTLALAQTRQQCYQGLGGVVISAAMLFLGAIQLLLYTYGLGLLYALALLWQTRRWPLLMGYLQAALLTLGLTAAQWLPLWDLRDSLSRGGLQPSQAAIYSLTPGQLVGLLIGDHAGSQETLTYTGLGLLVLAGVGLLWQPGRNRLWWGGVVLAGLYSLGEHFILWPALTTLLPPLLWFRVPSRAWLLVSLLLPYLAAWGLQSLLTAPATGRTARLSIVGLIGLGLSCGLASQVTLSQSEIKLEALWGIFFLPLAAGLVALAIFRRAQPQTIAIAFCLLVLADSAWINRSLIQGRPKSAWLNPTPPALIADLAQTGGRIYTPDYAIPQQDTATWGIARFDGVDPFQLANFIAITEAATGVPRQGYSTTVPAVVVLPEDASTQPYQQAPMNPQLLGYWGVEWVITRYELNIQGLTLAQQAEGLYFYRNEFGWGDSIRLDWQGPNQVRQTIGQNDLIQLRTVVQALGWQTMQGRPAGRDPLSLPILSQTYHYNPSSVRVGVGISAASLILLGAGGLMVRRARAV
jgi:hypothetical protein